MRLRDAQRKRNIFNRFEYLRDACLKLGCNAREREKREKENRTRNVNYAWGLLAAEEEKWLEPYGFVVWLWRAYLNKVKGFFISLFLHDI